MRTVADHDVEQDHADALVVQGALEVRAAQRGLDHRMRMPARVLVVAQVEQPVPRARALGAGNRDVRRDFQAVVHEHDLRFGAQRAAAKETVDGKVLVSSFQN